MGGNQEQYKEHLLEIIARLKDGKASDAEIREIDQWYEESTIQEKYTDGMSNAEILQVKEKILQRINHRIYHEAVPVKKISAYSNLQKWIIAAVLMVIIGGSLFYFFNSNKALKFDEQALANNIIPGGNKAVLTLNNGQKINLNDAINGQLATQAGILITKTAHGQLIYQVGENIQSKVDGPTYNTIEVPAGGKWEAVLSDGTHIWLNALSSITFPTIFTGKERKVEIRGEAYFEVAKDQRHPFIVKTKTQQVEVLGTHFNICSYEEDLVTKTTLLEGSIRISLNGSNVSEILKPGEQAMVSERGITVNNTDVEESVAWKNGYFMFNNERQESIMRKISRWYNVEVEYADPAAKEVTYYGTVWRFEKVGQLLRKLEQTGEVSFELTKNKIIVHKKTNKN